MMDEYMLQNTCLTPKGYGFFEPSNAEFYSHNHAFNTTDLSPFSLLSSRESH